MGNDSPGLPFQGGSKPGDFIDGGSLKRTGKNEKESKGKTGEQPAFSIPFSKRPVSYDYVFPDHVIHKFVANRILDRRTIACL